MTTTLSVRIDTETKKRLEALAKRARRSKSFIAAEAIAAFVEAGRPGRAAGTRELVVPGTPYVIPYRLRGDRLEIIAVFHGRVNAERHSRRRRRNRQHSKRSLR